MFIYHPTHRGGYAIFTRFLVERLVCGVLFGFTILDF